jgi:surface protein
MPLKRIDDFDPLFTNQVADNDQIAIWDTDAGEQKKITVKAFAEALSSRLIVAAPINFLVTPSAPEQLTLTWDDPSGGIASFEIQRSIDGITYSTINNTATGVTHFINTGLDDNVLYYYRIRSNLSSQLSAWVLADETTLNPFRITVKTDNAGVSASNEFRIPWVVGGTYQYNVWYNGAIIHTANGATNTDNTIVFSDGAGTKNIAFTGTLERWSFNNGADRLKMITVSRWGISDLWNGTNPSVFYGCANMDITATDNPIISGSNFSSAFRDCTSLVFNSSINNWNISGVSNLSACFRGCTLFNQPLSNWDVSNVTLFTSALRSCTNFNQDISNWDTGNGAQFQEMLLGCVNFNQNIGIWNMQKATQLQSMLSSATAFNQNLGNWDVISRTGRTTINMTGMLNSSGINTANYDSTLVGWEAQAPVTVVTLGALGVTYTAAGAGGTARASLISTYGWTITDAGGV